MVGGSAKINHMQELSMVHGRLPGSSWLGWPSGKEKRREEFQTYCSDLSTETAIFHEQSMIQYM